MSLYSLHKFLETSVWQFEALVLMFKCVRSHKSPFLSSFRHIQDGDEIVEHMNILSVSQALDHVCFSPFYDTRIAADAYIIAERETMA